MARRKKKKFYSGKTNSLSSIQNNSKKDLNKKFTHLVLGALLAIATGVIGWFLTAPNVYFVENVYPPIQPSVQSFNPGKFVVRGGMVTKFRNISFRQAAIAVEIVPVAAAIFPESDSKMIERIERIPESFDESRAIVDVSPSAIPQFALTEVRADALFHLKLVAKRAVYIYKLKWKVEGQGEIYSTCMRFPLWSNEMSPVSDKDSYSIKCD